ncbi:MAG TPA: META domain-containing protein, partial [Acidimicrobiales bacterium]
LEGTTWVLDGFLDGDVASSLPAGGSATVTFDPATGRVLVDDTGCNGGGGSYSVDPGAAPDRGQVTISDFATTLMRCEGPAMAVEDQVVAVLGGPVDYEIEADRLTLLHADGKGITLRAG